jgi:uncharacterized SAM-binding protein YcdF (DUF218 family)
MAREMTKNRSKRKAALLLIPTLILLLWFVTPAFVGIVNAGNIFGAGFCVGVILLWAFCPLIKQKKLLRIFFRIIIALIIAGFAWATFLSINMLIAMGNTPNPDKDCTVIVLGCQVRNGVPSRMFVQRLTAALNFMDENEAVMCVTTGGYGQNQPVSEAEVGRNWLIGNDVKESRIFLENSSTNTFENLTLARDIILQEGLPQDVVIVSDGFHLWRATMTAEDLFGAVYVISARTPITAIPTYWVREWFALTRDIVK